MKKFAAGIASFAMLLNVATPAFASSTTLEIVDNGADSNNSVNVSSNTQTSVTQTNNSTITNNVSASSSSGGNSASKNTGGNVSVSTGDTATIVSVENTANNNVANVDNCSGCDTEALVHVSGNGADSKNNAGLKLENETKLYQTNSGDIVNKVKADSYSGDNKVSKNTGGDVEVLSGESITHVGVTTHANSNMARLGGDASGDRSVELKVTDNGAESRNNIWLGLDRDVLLTQRNGASVRNFVTADSSTGSNSAGRNTGGSVMVDSGDAFTEVLVDNAANFNWANLDCDCLTDVSAKVADNGADTHNKIKAYLSDDKDVFQDNSCGLSEVALFGGWHGPCGVSNSLHADSATGDNDAWANTADSSDDPSITTGDAETFVGVENTGNSNSYGTPSDSDWDFGGMNFNISFNLGDLLGALGFM